MNYLGLVFLFGCAVASPRDERFIWSTTTVNSTSYTSTKTKIEISYNTCYTTEANIVNCASRKKRAEPSLVDTEPIVYLNGERVNIEDIVPSKAGFDVNIDLDDSQGNYKIDQAQFHRMGRELITYAETETIRAVYTSTTTQTAMDIKTVSFASMDACLPSEVSDWFSSSCPAP